MEKNVREAFLIVFFGAIGTEISSALRLSKWANAAVWFLLLVWFLKNK